MNWLYRLSLAAALVCGLSLVDTAEASRVNLQYQHCMDDDGAVVSGCRAYTFEAGTSTIHQLYSDKARTTAHGDYVAADSSGRFPDAFGDPSQCIKVSYRKSDGSTVLDELDWVCPPADASTASEARTALGVSGGAATASTGTSGNVLCFLNTACIYSALQTFNSNIEVNSTSAAATAAPTITLSRDSTSPVADDEMGEIVFQGKDDGTGDVDYGTVEGVIIDPSDGAEYGQLQLLAILNGTNTAVLEVGALDSSDTSATGVNLETGNYYKAGFYAPGTPLAALEYSPSSGTDDNTCTSGGDRTRQLDTEVYDPYSLVSISSDQFTLQPGTYVIEWSAPATRVNKHQSFLYDVTNTTEIKRGTTENSDRETDSESEAIAPQTRSIGIARVTVASATAYEIRHRCQTSHTPGFGDAASFGEEVYTTVKITAG